MNQTQITDLAVITDLAYWKPVVTPKEFAALCADARTKNIRAVSVTGSRLVMAAAASLLLLHSGNAGAWR